MTLGRDPEDHGCGPGGCDHEAIFELADGGLGPDEAREVRQHLDECEPCQELYEQEMGLNSYLCSEDFLEQRPTCSVHRGVVMALPTRSPVARLLWAAFAGALLVVALAYLESNDTEPEMLAMSILAACWGIVSGGADVVRALLTAAGPFILFILILGALADLLIALVYLSVSRRRKAREA